jgi:thymidylate kinase
VPGNLTASLAAHQVIVLEGCDGVGKTTLAEALAARHGHTIVHSGRTPDGTDLADRYETILALPGRLVLDRSFISELVYGPLDRGRSRLTLPAAITLTQRVAERGGVLVHLTGHPEIIATRLQARQEPAPSVDRIRTLISAYHSTFAVLRGTAPIVNADTTAPGP